MSKVKRKKKRASTGKPIKPAKKSIFHFSVDALLPFIPYFFLIILTGFFIRFWVTLNGGPDFQSEIITSVPGLIAKQQIIFTMLIICFGYFGWRYLHSPNEFTRFDKIMTGLTFVTVAAIYLASFTEQLSPNGDNAEYLILAKSLVERGAPLRLESPNETPNTLASLGLPLMLAPIYKIWGFDFVKMKILIVSLALLVFPMLIYLFKTRHKPQLAILLALTCVTSPYLVGSSTDMMTETPYLFWSLLSILLILRYSESDRLQVKYLVLVIFGIAMSFLTRSVGISLLVAGILYLSLQVSWSNLFKSKLRSRLFASSPFLKLLVILGPILLGGIVLQVWQQSKGISQASMFLSFKMLEFLEQNFISSYRVLGQMIVSAETYRFQNFFPSATLPPVNFGYVLLLLIMLWGFLIGVRRKDLPAFYALTIFLLIILASNTPAEMVLIRYLSVVLPFIIYYTYLGVVATLKFIFRKFRLQSRPLVNLVALLLLAQVLIVNLFGNSVNINRSGLGNGPSYDDFIEVAKWAKGNLSEDAYVMSVKPRLFYLLSDKKGARFGFQGQEYSPAFEQEQLKLFREQGITHIVVDGISGTTRRNVIPIIKNNPDMFQTMYIGSVSSSSSIAKIIYKTE